ncbi:hypothetical protein EGX94_04875 [Propionibacterium acidifaciens]|uniref:nucleic acid/nucleotide deaminase domain-containing protein n=1 Tax=Propionibacterium acidifaciens TaxID=556499 RepID=UPI0009DC0AA5|nr:hypothetical protein EGX94_04875 [Propionibacterium acidifaciens]
MEVFRSNKDWHAEQGAVKQYGDRIVELYTERQPCSSRCDPMLRGRNIDTTYSYPWTSGANETAQAIRDTTNSALGDAVRNLFGR